MYWLPDNSRTNQFVSLSTHRKDESQTGQLPMIFTQNVTVLEIGIS